MLVWFGLLFGMAVQGNEDQLCETLYDQACYDDVVNAGLFPSLSGTLNNSQIQGFLYVILTGQACDIPSCQLWSEQMLEMSCFHPLGAPIKDIGNTIAMACQNPKGSKEACGESNWEAFESLWASDMQSLYEKCDGGSPEYQRIVKYLTGQMCDVSDCVEIYEKWLQRAPDCTFKGDGVTPMNWRTIATLAGQNCGLISKPLSNMSNGSPLLSYSYILYLFLSPIAYFLLL